MGHNRKRPAVLLSKCDSISTKSPALRKRRPNMNDSGIDIDDCSNNSDIDIISDNESQDGKLCTKIITITLGSLKVKNLIYSSHHTLYYR